jgi:hypothetical protein
LVLVLLVLLVPLVLLFQALVQDLALEQHQPLHQRLEQRLEQRRHQYGEHQILLRWEEPLDLQCRHRLQEVLKVSGFILVLLPKLQSISVE